MIADPTTRPRRLRLPRLHRGRVSRGRAAVVVGVLVLVLGGGWLWLRDSSLVAIKTVSVRGLSGPSVGRIRATLVNEALTMTTLNADTTKLRNSLAGYPFVHSLSVSTSFPHGIEIDVVEWIPVATVKVGNRQVPVDSDGLLLPQDTAVGSLPSIPLSTEPGGSTVTAAGARAALTALGVAPYPLLARIASATWSASRGVVLQLRNGPQIYFGTMSQLGKKWASAIGVLGNPHTAGAQYIDVSSPTRPAAGVPLGSTTTTGGLATANTATAGGTVSTPYPVGVSP